jgi:tripartite-type tricarboxylate transporter receptor subunit TctC
MGQGGEVRGHQAGVTLKLVTDNFGEGNAMKLPRRTFLRLAAGAAALPVVTRAARAQAYPTRPVRIVVPFAAGGTADILGRLWGQWLSERLGQQFIIDNRAGAATNTGTEAVVRATADGYTLLLVTPPNVVNVTLYENLNFNFLRDIAPVASVSTTPGVVVVNPRFPARTIPELIVYARANPGKIAMATQGNGGSAHIYGEMFKQMVGVDMVAVPYRGEGPALTDLIGGQVQIMFAIMPSAIEYIRAGTLRALAVTDAARAQVLPDIPTVAEFVPGYQAAAFQGIGAPRTTPSEIVNKLNTEINGLLGDPKVKARLADLGSTALALSPADFGKLIAAESEKWGKVIRAANIKPE